MTRINLVPPSELCDQHLLAELRELKRIPNMLISGKLHATNIPTEFCLGKGHVKFFCDKLDFLYQRYYALLEEALMRGFKVQDMWPFFGWSRLPSYLFRDWVPRAEDIFISRNRIAEKMPVRARWSNRL